MTFSNFFFKSHFCRQFREISPETATGFHTRPQQLGAPKKHTRKYRVNRGFTATYSGFEIQDLTKNFSEW
jgi:hypothetical protein